LAGNSLVDLLQKAGLLDDRQADAVMSRTGHGAGGNLVQQIAELGYSTEGETARVVSVELGLPRVDFAMTPPEPEAVALLDLRTCLDRFVLPVALRERGELLWLAMADPTDVETMVYVRRRSGKRIKPVVALPTELVREARRQFGEAESAPAPAGDDDSISLPEDDSISLPDDGGDQFRVVSVGDEIDEVSAGAGPPPSAPPAQVPSARPAPELRQSSRGETSQRPAVAPPTISRRGTEPPATGARRGTEPPATTVRRGTEPPAVPRARTSPPVNAPRPGTNPPVGGRRGTYPPPAKPATMPPTLPPIGVPAGPPGRRTPTLDQEAYSQDPLGVLPPVPQEAMAEPSVEPLAELLQQPFHAEPTVDDLTDADRSTLGALQVSLQRGAIVLQAVAELCVEKGLFLPDEISGRTRK
jgi:hypothetical protein